MNGIIIIKIHKQKVPFSFPFFFYSPKGQFYLIF